MLANPATTLTIQQMTARSGLSEYTLRYYEKVGLIMPIPREGSSGHRRYSAETAQLVEQLACLRASGLPLEEMRRYIRLRAHGDAAAAEQKRCLRRTLKRYRRISASSPSGSGISAARLPTGMHV